MTTINAPAGAIGVTQAVLSVSAGSLDSSGNIAAAVLSAVDTNNSSAAVLAGGASFTGTATDVSRYASVNVSVFADQVSATDGLSIQQSSDGTNWDIRDTYTVPAMSAGGGKTYSVQTAAKWARIVYTNGATLQTAFRLQAIIKPAVNPSNSVRPSDAYSNENDLQQSEAFGMLWNGATWDRAKSAPYQTSQTPLVNASGNKANAAAAATLTGTASTTVYLAGFECTATGATTGLGVTVTVTGVLGGTLSYTFAFPAGVLVEANDLIVAFNPPLPASAVNTPIVVSMPAGGTGNTNATTVAHGFFQ